MARRSSTTPPREQRTAAARTSSRRRPSPPAETSSRAVSGAAAAPGPAGAGVWLARAANVAVVLAAFAFSFRKIDDFDTWWHLASGRWIAVHHAIPTTDTLSFTVPDHPWINLQWAFDLVLYLLHAHGGPLLVGIAGAAVFVAAVVLLLRLVERQIGPGLGALLVLGVVVTAQERINLRPEIVSYLLLVAVLTVLDDGRRHDGRGWWRLVPLMLVWVNVHSLFVMGAFAIVCALVGTLEKPPRQLLVWGGAALASVVVNPYGLEGVAFPLKLVSRINGSMPVFQTIGEFGSPFAADAAGVSAVGYKVLLVLGIAAAVTALVVSLRGARGRARASAPRFDWGGAVLFAGLAVVSVAARRNVALFAIGAAPFVAWCLGVVLTARPRMRVRLAGAASLAAVTAGLVLAGSAVTGAYDKWQNLPEEFGAGVIDGTFPVRAAAFAEAAALPSPLYNDMASGGYLAWRQTLGGRVFVDSRLEVYDTPFLTEFMEAKSDPARWDADADRYRVQTAFISHQFESDRILAGHLFQDAAWTMVYVDEVAAIFVRTRGNATAIARAAALRPEWDAKTAAWLAQPSARWPYPAGRVDGTRAYARFMATIGRAQPSVEAYLKLLDLGLRGSEEIEIRLRLARYFASTGRRAEAQDQARRVLAIDPANAEALRLAR